MRDRHKERKRRKAGGNSCHEERDWQQLKGRKKEEWKRLDALYAVFSPPPPLPQPSLMAVDDWGAAAVGQSVGGGWKGGWQSLQQLWWSRDDRQGAPPHAPVFKSTAAAADSGGTWAVPHLFPFFHCAVVWRWLPSLGPPRASFAATKTQHLCLGAAPFSFFLPSLFSFSSFHLSLIRPSRSSSLQASQTTKVQQILSLLPSLSPSRLLATTTLRLLTRKVCRACASFCWLAWYIVFFSRPYREGRGQGSLPPLFRFFFFLKEKMRW